MCVAELDCVHGDAIDHTSTPTKCVSSVLRDTRVQHPNPQERNESVHRVQCARKVCPTLRCRDFLLAECPASTHAAVSRLYTVSCNYVAPSPPSPPSDPPNPPQLPMPPHPPPPPASNHGILRRASSEQPSDPDCSPVTYSLRTARVPVECRYPARYRNSVRMECRFAVSNRHFTGTRPALNDLRTISW